MTILNKLLIICMTAIMTVGITTPVEAAAGSKKPVKTSASRRDAQNSSSIGPISFTQICHKITAPNGSGWDIKDTLEKELLNVMDFEQEARLTGAMTLPEGSLTPSEVIVYKKDNLIVKVEHPVDHRLLLTTVHIEFPSQDTLDAFINSARAAGAKEYSADGIKGYVIEAHNGFPGIYIAHTGKNSLTIESFT